MLLIFSGDGDPVNVQNLAGGLVEDDCGPVE
jgi:hypothetical protein